MKKISKITLKREIDDIGPDYLGVFAQEPGKFAIKHDGGPRTHPYFNAANVSNMKEARQNYKRAMQFEEGSVYMIGIKAEAEVLTSIDAAAKGHYLINHISSGGLWGIESDSGKEYFDEVANEQKEDLRQALRELGFSDAEIDAAPVIDEIHE